MTLPYIGVYIIASNNREIAKISYSVILTNPRLYVRIILGKINNALFILKGEVFIMRNVKLMTQARFAKQGEDLAVVSLPHTWNAFDGQDGGNDYWRGIGT